MTTTTLAQNTTGNGSAIVDGSTPGSGANLLSASSNPDNENVASEENNNQHIIPHLSYSEEEDEAIRQQQLQQQQQHILGNLDDQDEGRRYRGYIHPHQQQLHAHHLAAQHAHNLHPHAGQLHPNFEQLERDYHRPVDLGYIRSAYSPGGGNPNPGIASADWSGGAHQLIPGQGWMDEGPRGGLLWTTEQQNQYYRHQVSSMKWEPPSVRPPSVGGLSNRSKLCSPRSTGLSGLSDLIPDETLAQLSVKELNKKVQNLPRDDIVALKQRRRTLKNRGYAMNCRLRRQETREKLEVHVKQLEEQLRKTRCERDYYRSRCDKLQQYINQSSITNGQVNDTLHSNSNPQGGPNSQGHGGSGGGLVALVHDIPIHAHLMPPLSHGHLNNNHHQGVQLDLSRNGANSEYKRYASTPGSSSGPCDLKLPTLSRL